MPRYFSSTTPGKFIILLWSVACLVIFIYFPGAISHVFGVSLYDGLTEKTSRIMPTTFISDIVFSIGGMFFYGAACISLGLRLTGVFALRQGDTKPAMGALLPTCFLLGNIAYSITFLTIAAVYSLTGAIVAILLCFGFLSGLGRIKQLHYSFTFFRNWYENLLTVLSISIMAMSLFQSSARISFDASSIYFSNAKLSALTNHVGYFLENTFVASASQATILYTAIIQLFGDQAARMIPWLMGATIIWLGIEVARMMGASKTAMHILPALILTSTAFLDLLGDGKVDLLSSAYSLASIYWLLMAVQHREADKLLFVLTGVFTGFVCILRPHNVFLLGLFILFYIVQLSLDHQFTISQLTKQIGWIALGSSGFIVYHLLVNKIILGSPIAFLAVLTSINPTNGPWDYNPRIVWIYRLLYPLVVTFKNSGASLGNISPLIVAFFPFLAFASIRKRITWALVSRRLLITTLMVLISWVLLLFTVVEVRYVFFLWVILFIPISEILAGMYESTSVLVRWASIAGVVFLMIFVLFRSIYFSISTYSPLDKLGNPRCFDSVLCDQIEAINKEAALGSRVLVLTPFRYYLRTDLFACSTTHDEYNTLRTLSAKSAEQFWREAYRFGYEYIINDNGYTTAHLQFALIPGRDNIPNWIKLTTIYGAPGDPYVIYKVEGINPPVKRDFFCNQTLDSGVWQIQPVKE